MAPFHYLTVKKGRNSRPLSQVSKYLATQGGVRLQIVLQKASYKMPVV